jgi:hypothetical protein
VRVERQALRRSGQEGLARSHQAGHICLYLLNSAANGLCVDDFLPSFLPEPWADVPHTVIFITLQENGVLASWSLSNPLLF